jgi:hypothetical protein
MTRLRAAFDRFWFAEAPATRLATLRLIIGLYALIYLLDRYSLLSAVAATSRTYFEPVGPVFLLEDPLPAAVARGLVGAALIACAAFVLGFQYRFSGPLFALLLLWVLSYRNSWTMVYHTENLLVLHVLVLGLAPAADALSVDAFLNRPGVARVPVLGVWRGRNPVADWGYGYPIRLICAITVATYLLAAVAKLVGPVGWSWVMGDALRDQIAYDALRKELLATGATPLAFALYQQVALLTVVGVGSLAIELLAPLTLFSRPFAWVWVVAALSMHWGIYFIMDITFWYQQFGVAFVSFFDVEKPLGWIRGRLKAIAPGSAPRTKVHEPGEPAPGQA